MSHRWACLFGQPVAHSLSPTLHNAAFQAAGIDAHYEAREVAPDDLRGAVEALRAPDCFGANFTAPHKQIVLPLLDGASDEVRALGAANTIVNRGGMLWGYNTDGPGLARWMADAGIAARDRSGLVIGAGGAGRSAVWALAMLGASRIHVVNRTAERAQTLVEDLRAAGIAEATWGVLGQPIDGVWGVVINATSLGHHGGAPMVDPGCYSPQSVAIELAYNPPVTEFMRTAVAAGARAENGLGMLVHQAALAFEHWTGQAAPLDAYFAAVAQRVSRLPIPIASDVNRGTPGA